MITFFSRIEQDPSEPFCSTFDSKLTLLLTTSARRTETEDGLDHMSLTVRVEPDGGQICPTDLIARLKAFCEPINDRWSSVHTRLIQCAFPSGQRRPVLTPEHGMVVE